MQGPEKLLPQPGGLRTITSGDTLACEAVTQMEQGTGCHTAGIPGLCCLWIVWA